MVQTPPVTAKQDVDAADNMSGSHEGGAANEAALVAAHHNPSMKAFADRLRKAGKPHKVIITAVARKLVNLANALCKSRQKWKPSTA